VRPILLESNQLHRSYRGGPAIARFRGTEPSDEHAPEDWVGSTTTVFGDERQGLTTLPDGSVLRDAIAADPEAFLGPAHAKRYGSDPALLVKLLHAGERLPVHCHPSRAFARRHLDCPFGKTEAWVIVETEGARPLVHLGFRQDVEAATLAGWVERQETTTMLRALHALEVRPGDAVLVPAGVPHAIGEGVFVVELQEPTDFSVLLERDGFVGEGRGDGHLGIGYDLALSCVDRSGFGEETVARLRRRAREAQEIRPGVWSVLLADADPYFRAERLLPQPTARLEPAFSILVVLDGEGRLETEHGGELPLAQGDTVLVPYASGAGRVAGPVEAIRCLPPALDIPNG
jgi:mannose-6-phosphate isomerase